MVVLDASVTLAWCFEDESDQYSQSVLKHAAQTSFIVPSIWPLEIANVLLVTERKGRITTAASVQFIGLMADLPITVELEPRLHHQDELMGLARRHNLSAYDASYLRLALKRGAALATKDASLVKAASDAGVPYWNPSGDVDNH